MTSANITANRVRPLTLVGIYAVLVTGALLVLGPFILSVMTSLKTPQQLATESKLALPWPLTLENFERLFSGEIVDFSRSILVTAGYVGIVIVCQLVFSILAAYAFARLNFPGRDALFWVYLSTLMVPAVVTIIPLYLMVSELGLRNTFWGLVLPYLFGSPYAIFLLREYFRGIPQELVDAARIDGAGNWLILIRIILPLSRPIIATLGIITAVTHWNNFMWPLIITSGPEWSVITTSTASVQTQFNGNWTIVMAATTLALLPLILLFVAFNKQIVSSIAITSFR
ncbi:multiple sugar transport system permease protein [Leucobacter exalbidus]|uniref:Multiple sugar transport system permease protein n=1 Tax=Leucobacter exalbidus TaxID=662960 RepID=A0A940PU51_9MICO|nr:carbohydrate ABC transporter permease [Leucobacter exalbidus]MBP1325329.1 multiple sugar transport system permease protein [Leucobacter exalbidus]